MTPPSSIFSFSTLRVRPWLPKSLLLAIVLLAGAELAARRAVATHRLHVDAFARRLIQEHRAAIAAHRADVWLMGNSTLDYGVDDAILRQHGVRFVKLPHGSATVSASAKMLASYLKTAPHPPTEILLFITKDDLNLHGYRAEVSQGYTTLFSGPGRRPQEFLMLWQTRAHIVEMIEQKLKGLIHRRRPAKAHAAPAPIAASSFDGFISPNDDDYLRLVKNFSLDRAAIADFASAARVHGIARVGIVLMPCTDAYARFHDAKEPNDPYEAVRAEIGRRCAAAGVQFYDFGAPSSAYQEFRDGYHLNPLGAARFTRELIEKHVL